MAAEIHSMPYHPNAEQCCEACAFGSGKHSSWCEAEIREAMIGEFMQNLAAKVRGSDRNTKVALFLARYPVAESLDDHESYRLADDGCPHHADRDEG